MRRLFCIVIFPFSINNSGSKSAIPLIPCVMLGLVFSIGVCPGEIDFAVLISSLGELGFPYYCRENLCILGHRTGCHLCADRRTHFELRVGANSTTRCRKAQKSGAACGNFPASSLVSQKTARMRFSTKNSRCIFNSL